MTDILADYREWAANVPTRVSTHNERCHLYHAECMIHRLARRLEEAALTDAEREAIDYAWCSVGRDDAFREQHASELRETLEQLLERTK